MMPAHLIVGSVYVCCDDDVWIGTIGSMFVIVAVHESRDVWGGWVHVCILTNGLVLGLSTVGITRSCAPVCAEQCTQADVGIGYDDV